jgi:hypothetical protein
MSLADSAISFWPHHSVNLRFQRRDFELDEFQAVTREPKLFPLGPKPLGEVPNLAPLFSDCLPQFRLYLLP